jgi:hypothetical protein
MYRVACSSRPWALVMQSGYRCVWGQFEHNEAFARHGKDRVGRTPTVSTKDDSSAAATTRAGKAFACVPVHQGVAPVVHESQRQAVPRHLTEHT